MSRAAELPTLSVVVPTYNRHDELRACLEALAAQTRAPLEVLVVDQSPSHPPAVQDFLDRLAPPFRVVRRGTPNLPAARNEGLRSATGEVVVFVDDDALPPPGFLAAHAANYADERVGSVAGALLVEPGRTAHRLPREAADPWMRFFASSWQYDQRRAVTHGPGGNHSSRRAAALEAGGFDEEYTGPAFREESDFFIRFTAARNWTVYDPACWLLHPPARRPGGCWEGYAGVPLQARFANDARFVLKNFPRGQWPRFFAHAFRGALLRRDALARPRYLGLRLLRLLRGWRAAWNTAPRGAHAVAAASALRERPPDLA